METDAPAGLVDLSGWSLADLLTVSPGTDPVLDEAIRRAVDGAGQLREAASAFNSAI